MNSNNRKVALALGLTFGAIWTGDSVFLEALGPAFSVLYMRCASAVLYLLFLLCGKLFYEKHERTATSRSEHLVASGRFLIPSCIIGLCCYIAGGTLILFNFGHPYLGFALTKIIGAPLTIGCMYLFGSPGRNNVMRDTAESVSLFFHLCPRTLFDELDSYRQHHLGSCKLHPSRSGNGIDNAGDRRRDEPAERPRCAQ